MNNRKKRCAGPLRIQGNSALVKQVLSHRAVCEPVNNHQIRYDGGVLSIESVIKWTHSFFLANLLINEKKYVLYIRPLTCNLHAWVSWSGARQDPHAHYGISLTRLYTTDLPNGRCLKGGMDNLLMHGAIVSGIESRNLNRRTLAMAPILFLLLFPVSISIGGVSSELYQLPSASTEIKSSAWVNLSAS